MTKDERARAKENLKTVKALAILAGEEEPHIDPSECVKALRRRLEYLDKKVSTKDASEGAMAYLRAERRALRWAIQKLEGVLAAERAIRSSEAGPGHEGPQLGSDQLSAPCQR